MSKPTRVEIQIGPLASHPSWEIRLQIARALPLLRWTVEERERVVAILRDDVKHPQKFGKAWSVDSLSRFAAGDASLSGVVQELIEEFERSGSPTLVARARQIRRRLNAPAPTARRTSLPSARLSDVNLIAWERRKVGDPNN